MQSRRYVFVAEEKWNFRVILQRHLLLQYVLSDQSFVTGFAHVSASRAVTVTKRIFSFRLCSVTLRYKWSFAAPSSVSLRNVCFCFVIFTVRSLTREISLRSATRCVTKLDWRSLQFILHQWSRPRGMTNHFKRHLSFFFVFFARR